MRHRLAERVHRTVDIGLDHQIQLLVRNVQQRVAAMDARVGHHAVQPAEPLHGFLDSTMDVSTVPGIARHKNQLFRTVYLFRSRAASSLMSMNPTFHPCWMNFLTEAAPIPVEPPVMSTVFIRMTYLDC